jgi:hypothetical protein
LDLSRCYIYSIIGWTILKHRGALPATLSLKCHRRAPEKLGDKNSPAHGGTLIELGLVWEVCSLDFAS